MGGEPLRWLSALYSMIYHRDLATVVYYHGENACLGLSKGKGRTAQYFILPSSRGAFKIAPKRPFNRLYFLNHPSPSQTMRQEYVEDIITICPDFSGMKMSPEREKRLAVQSGHHVQSGGDGLYVHRQASACAGMLVCRLMRLRRRLRHLASR